MKDTRHNKEGLFERFSRYIADHQLIAEGGRVLLAVSGGVDSMVMLSLFARSEWDVAVAHCNFHLRGEESDSDTELVEGEAGRLGIKCYVNNFDTYGEMARTGESLQVAARRLRYRWFAELAAEQKYDLTAVAHHRDDSIETFFINLFRGTGLRGLTGIGVSVDGGVSGGRVIRPLLFASRAEILEYARQNNVPFREDSSNTSTKYLRNHIRHELVPKLREISPSFDTVMDRNIQNLRSAQEFIDKAIEGIRNDIEEHSGDEFHIYPRKINADLPRDFVMYELLSPYGFNRETVSDICMALDSETPTGKRFYGSEYTALIDRGKIILSMPQPEEAEEMIVGENIREITFGGYLYSFEIIDRNNIGSIAVPPNTALLDAERITFPLAIRTWRDGDSFTPLGMSGTKKVSDFLIDAKIPMTEKPSQTVVVNDGDILWLTGLRIDERYKITDATAQVLKITRAIAGL